MTEKKISFGFKQVKKTQVLITSNAVIDKKDAVEMIDCLEGQTIKIIGKNEDEKEKPLVIPLKDSQKTSAALAMLQKLKETIDGAELQNETVVKSKTEPVEPTNNQPQTLEQRVITEILKEAKGIDNKIDDTNKFTVPINVDELPLGGASESTLDDYEQIPIDKFGLAMLRGMGLKEDEIVEERAKANQPELRPKGMGLGADKIAKPTKLLVQPAANEVLEIKKNACVKVLAGKYKDLYGLIESLNDETGRIVVKLALGGGRESISGSLVQVVSKQEYAQYSKVLNSAKYDEYKKKHDEAQERKIKQEPEVKNQSFDKRNFKYEEAHSSRRRSHSRDRDDYHHRKDDNFREKDEYYRGKDRTRGKNDEGNSKSSYRPSPASRIDESNTNPSKSRHRSRSNTKDKSRKKYRSSSSSSTASSDSSPSSRKESKKKHKNKSHKNSKSKYDSERDSRHLKKKTKKSKHARSRSRVRH